MVERRLIYTTVLIASLATGLGCQSFIASITSPSDSISGSSTAIGGSFRASFDGFSQSCSGKEPSQSEQAYGDDVRVFSHGWVDDAASADGFLRDLAVVADQHGISDWEASLMTYHALGVGLGEAGLSRAGADAFLQSAGLSGPERFVHVHEGHAVALP